MLISSPTGAAIAVQHRPFIYRPMSACIKENRDSSNPSPAMANELLIQNRKEQRGTHDQPTVLFVYRILLSELDAVSTVHPEGDHISVTNQVLHDCVPKVLCKFAHSMYVCVIFLVPNCARSVRNGQQIVLDPFESPGVVSVWAPTRNTRKIRTETRLSSA